MESAEFFGVVKELGFPIAVGGTLLLGAIGMVWFLLRNFLKQLEQQRLDLAEQRKIDRELTKEVVMNISATGTHLKNIADYMADGIAGDKEVLQHLRDNIARQDERHATNTVKLDELTVNQKIQMKMWDSVFQGYGDARQAIQVTESAERHAKKQQNKVLA